MVAALLGFQQGMGPLDYGRALIVYPSETDVVAITNYVNTGVQSWRIELL